MITKQKVKNLFKKALNANNTPHTLAFSASMGSYIAFSPFPGAHTIMMIITKCIFTVNFPILFIFTSINNPWTLIPFFTLDYVFGYWFVHSILGWNPAWAIPLEKIFGSGSICIWSFLIGGNILGIFAAIIVYPIARFFFTKLMLRHNNQILSQQPKQVS